MNHKTEARIKTLSELFRDMLFASDEEWRGKGKPIKEAVYRAIQVSDRAIKEGIELEPITRGIEDINAIHDDSSSNLLAINIQADCEKIGSVLSNALQREVNAMVNESIKPFLKLAHPIMIYPYDLKKK